MRNTEVMNMLVFFAVDMGPRATLEQLASRFGTTVLNTMPISSGKAGALVVGTSTSEHGRMLECAARLWARQLKIPIIAIEDYCGNCAVGIKNLAGRVTDPDLIIAESDFSRRCYMRKGFPGDKIVVLPPVRYDDYRKESPVFFRQRGRLRGMLWAGQPEQGMGQAALGWLAPWIRRNGLRLYFRTHPRDVAYAEGFWHEWMEKRNLRWVDCTSWDWVDVWAAPVDFVATAFSSVGLDAAFRGLPTLHILHPSSVRNLLMEQKGVARPGLVASGAALASAGPLGYAQIKAALGAANLRRVEVNFLRNYRGSGPVLDAVEEALRDIIEA